MINSGLVRLTIALCAGVMLMAATGGAAQARHVHRHWHAHHHVSAPTLVAQEPGALGSMRYYGGPKSPMWRAPATVPSQPTVSSQQRVADAPAAHLGAMRYYGGPKSPMWRGPAEN
jgi:hypothetical protein